MSEPDGKKCGGISIATCSDNHVVVRLHDNDVDEPAVANIHLTVQEAEGLIGGVMKAITAVEPGKVN